MLLSICIPTFNRAEYLLETLQSIVSQEAWLNGDAEIVVSDNCCTDSTKAVIAGFQEQYGSRVRCKHLETPIDAHDNFASALDMGQGKFLKLHNDTCKFLPGALGEYLALLKEYETVSPALILTPNCGDDAPPSLCASLDEAVLKVSYFLTWIGTYAISREVWRRIDDPMRCRELRLPQVDLAVRVMVQGGTAIADGRKYFELQEISNRAGYQVAEVFCKNYFSILASHISPEVLKVAKRRMLREYLILRHFDFFGEYNSIPQRGYWRNTVIYHRDIYFYLSFFKVALLWLVSRFFNHDRLRKIKHFFQRRKRS